MIEVLRLWHRIHRDIRLSTHVALIARAFGANKLYYSGQKDNSFENSVKEIVKDFGGNFKVEFVKDSLGFVKNYKGKIVHLTMYGLPVQENIFKIRKFKDLLVIVGGAKVEGEFYKLADFNISVTQQPHSETAALAIFLHEYFQSKELSLKFKNAKKEVIPQKAGKRVKTS